MATKNKRKPLSIAMLNQPKATPAKSTRLKREKKTSKVTQEKKSKLISSKKEASNVVKKTPNKISIVRKPLDISMLMRNAESPKVVEPTLIKKPRNQKLFSLFLFVLGTISVFAITLPLLPLLESKLNPPDPTHLKYPTSYSDVLGTKDEEQTGIPTENRLVIPKIGVDAEIVEGNNEDILLIKEGVWRQPTGSTPTQPGNMTIAGHRFQYLPPNTKTLYSLDQMKVGDTFLVYWEGKDYAYEIHSVFEVYPEQIEILRDSDIKNEITIYTCTPIYTSEKRLVVKARMV